MKTTGIIVCIFLFMGIVSVQAQEAPAMPEFFFVMEEFVQPADLQAFSKTQQEAVDLWKKFELDLTVFTYATDASSFYWVLPIESFASMDQMFAKVGEVVAKMQEDGYEADKEFRDLSTSRESVIHWEKDLSYHPNGYVGQTTDKKYCEWTFLYLKNGHQKEAAGVIKEYIDYYNSIEETWEWDVYSVSLGYDSPCWIIMDRAENPLALSKLENTLQEKYSDKFGELWKKMQPHLRRMDVTTGWFMPKWSLNYER